MNRNSPASPVQPAPALRLRTGLTAGGYASCMAYCDRERLGCFRDPALPNDLCEDRYPVCQNACTVCGSTNY